MPLSEREKRDRGDWYDCRGPELLAAQEAARRACHAHGTLPPDARGAMAPELRALFASVGEEVWLEAPFHCAYGHNITFGDRVYLNTGCVILDTGPVMIGAGTMMGPGVQIYCADHHHDRALRTEGLERALPVSIGADVWIGGGAILLPGIRIGDGAIIGAGSVVTRDIPPGARAVGNPARILPDQA